MMNENQVFPGSGYPDFATMLHMLTRPDAFPVALPDDKPVTVIQTHASAVPLTPERVYKLKKPKNFGFFDFSTPALRRHFCGEEVRLNRRLTPHVYLGVAPVLVLSDCRFRFGPALAPGDMPMPGTLLDGGYVVDYAVVMVRLPDEAMLEYLVRAGTASPSLLKEIAQHVAAFHATSCTNEHIASFGSLEVIRGNWEENFEQMRPYIGRTIDVATYDQIAGYIRSFLDQRTCLFESRMREGRIRDCHGDLRLHHVYFLEGQPINTAEQLPRLAFLDGIEFNERFRFRDVTSEVAFLTMELEAASRCDLADAFVDGYVAESGDQELRELLPFYSCYRACVRGKVLSFQVDEPEVPASQREAACGQAASLFALAASYTSGPIRPTLMLVGGLMGTGKSTLALSLQHELGWTIFSSDTVRKRLAHLNPAEPHANDYGQGLYSQQWTARTYDTLLTEARADRQAAAREAAAYGANALFVECTCPKEVTLKRLAQRWKARIGECKGTVEAASRESDARPDLYDAQCAAWEAYIPAEEPGMERVVVSTTLPLAKSREQVFDILHMLRLACWLWYNDTEA
jgi:uncharacterized protein